MTTEEIIANVESICRKLQVEHLYLFGSYLSLFDKFKGKAKEYYEMDE